MARRFSSIFLLSLMALTAFAASASAEHVQCGDVITQDTRLDSDLIDCPGDGIIIGADGVTLSLAGHVVDGDGDVGGLTGTGIEVEGRRDVVIRNGIVQEFLDGVSVLGSEDVVVQRIVGQDNYEAFVCGLSSSGCVFSRDFAIGGLHGFFIENSGDTTATAGVQDSTVSGISSYAIEVLGTAQVLRNAISESGGGISVSDGGEPTARSVVSGNNVALSEPTANNSGISVWTSFGADVIRNSVSGSYLYGIRLRLPAGQALVSRNTVTDNAGHGIWLEVAGANLLVERNTALGNGADGLNLSGPNTTVARNRADRNGELGINAPGVIDGGGNRARGNGNPAQCAGVSCK